MHKCKFIYKTLLTVICCFRCDHACTVAGEKFYIMGGTGGKKLWYNDLHVFDTGMEEIG